MVSLHVRTVGLRMVSLMGPKDGEPKGSEPNVDAWYLEPHTMDLTAPGADDISGQVSDGSSNSDSEIVLRSEENIITIDLDNMVDVSIQTDLIPPCKCEEVMTGLAELMVYVQALNNKVDTSFETLNGRLNLTLDTFISMKDHHQTVSSVMTCYSTSTHT